MGEAREGGERGGDDSAYTSGTHISDGAGKEAQTEMSMSTYFTITFLLLLLFFSFSLSLFHSFTLSLFFSCSLVLLFSCSLVLLFSCSLVLFFSAHCSGDGGGPPHMVWMLSMTPNDSGMLPCSRFPERFLAQGTRRQKGESVPPSLLPLLLFFSGRHNQGTFREVPQKY